MLRPITAKIKTCKQATKPGTNSCSSLQFSFLMPDWLFSCTTITFQNISGVHGFPGLTVFIACNFEVTYKCGSMLSLKVFINFFYSLSGIVHTMNRDYIMHQVVACKRFKATENNKIIRSNSGCGLLWGVVVFERL